MIDNVDQDTRIINQGINGNLVYRHPALCSYYDNSSTSNGPHVQSICDTINLNIAHNSTVFTYLDNSSTSHSVTNNYHVKYNTTIKVDESGTYTFILKCDGSCIMTFDGQLTINLTSSVERGEESQNFTVDLEANTYYPTLIEYNKYTGDSKLQLYWIRPGQSTEELVPSDYLGFDYYYGGQRRELNITLPDKYTARYTDSRMLNYVGWGDGMRIGNEQWDDNNTNNADGCSSDCKVEKGYICTGGSAVESDTWVRCPVGYKPYRYFENTDYVDCIPETDNYDIVFYITVALLSIGMIIYFIKDYMRVNEQDKPEEFDRPKKHQDEMKIQSEDLQDQNIFEEEKHQDRSDKDNINSRFIIDDNLNELQRARNQKRVEEQETNITDTK